MDQIWSQIQRDLKNQIGTQDFEIWISPIRYASRNANKIYFHVPNRYYKHWIQQHYSDKIQRAFQHLLAEPVIVQFLVGDEQIPTQAPQNEPHSPSTDPVRVPTPTILSLVPDPPTNRSHQNTAQQNTAQQNTAQQDATQQDAAQQDAAQQSLLQQVPQTFSSPDEVVGYPSTGDASSISPGKTFDNFVVGACNAFAHATAHAVAETPGTEQYNPLYIYGSTGLGKTHLLHAIGNQLLQRQPNAHVLYVSAEQFTNDLIDALRYRRMPSFRERYRRRPTILLMDDVQFLSNKDRTQEELFHTFEWLKERGRQIVFTSDVLPRDIKMFEPRLRTRFESGMLADTQPPDMETMIAILQQKAEDMQLYLPKDLAQYIASRVRGNIREVEGILNRLKALCQLHQATPTIEFAQKYLSNILADQPHALSTEDVIQTVASFFNIKVADLKGKRRLKQFVRARHVSMWLIRKHTDLSFPDIGRAFNGRDHATVQHACKKINGLIEDKDDVDLINTIKLLETSLGR